MEKKSKYNMETLKTRILFVIAAVVLIAGIIGVLNRGDGTDKLIGTVFIVTDNDSSEIEGYKLQKQYEDEIKEYENFPSNDAIKQECNEFKQSDSGNIAVSFTGTYTGDVLYSVYNFSDNTPVYENRNSLTIPASHDETENYLVKIEVKWGKIKNNVTVDYYFNMQV